MLLSIDITLMMIIAVSALVLVGGAYAVTKYILNWQKQEDKISKSFKDTTFNLLIQREDNIFPPPLPAQTALNLLQGWLLGEDWYTVTMGPEQVNTEIVYQILNNYSEEFRKECDLRRKINSLKPYELNPNWTGSIFGDDKEDDEND